MSLCFINFMHFFSRFDIHVGSKVLGKKSNDIWYKGIVQEISHKDKTVKSLCFIPELFEILDIQNLYLDTS